MSCDRCGRATEKPPIPIIGISIAERRGEPSRPFVVCSTCEAAFVRRRALTLADRLRKSPQKRRRRMVQTLLFADSPTTRRDNV